MYDIVIMEYFLLCYILRFMLYEGYVEDGQSLLLSGYESCWKEYSSYLMKFTACNWADLLERSTGTHS